MRKINPERMRQFEFEVEMDRLFYMEFEKNIDSIENHEHFIRKCLDFMSAYGVPACNTRTLGGQILTIADMYNHMFQHFEASEDYESAARLTACNEMPDWLPWEMAFKVVPLLKQFYLDSTMMMSYEESMIKVQQKMIDTTEFFGLEKPHDYVKVMDRVIEYHHYRLEYDDLKVLESIRTEAVQLFGMEK